MTNHLIPEDEEARLAAVRQYDILATPPDGRFDRITALAARILQTPIAIVSIVDEDRIWFKSRHGVEGVSEIVRDPGLVLRRSSRTHPGSSATRRLIQGLSPTPWWQGSSGFGSTPERL